MTGKGAGTARGNMLSATIRPICASGSRLEFPITLAYRAADDTPVDQVGVVWSRVNAVSVG